MEQVRFRRDRLSGYARITKLCRIVDQRLFLIGAVAGDKPVDAHTGRGRAGGQARPTQDLATINRHLAEITAALTTRSRSLRPSGATQKVSTCSMLTRPPGRLHPQAVLVARQTAWPLGRRIDGSMRKCVPQQRRHADLAAVGIRNPTLSPFGPSRMMTLWSIGPIGDSTCVWSSTSTGPTTREHQHL